MFNHRSPATTLKISNQYIINLETKDRFLGPLILIFTEKSIEMSSHLEHHIFRRYKYCQQNSNPLINRAKSLSF